MWISYNVHCPYWRSGGITAVGVRVGGGSQRISCYKHTYFLPPPHTPHIHTCVVSAVAYDRPTLHMLTIRRQNSSRTKYQYWRLELPIELISYSHSFTQKYQNFFSAVGVKYCHVMWVEEQGFRTITKVHMSARALGVVVIARAGAPFSNLWTLFQTLAAPWSAYASFHKLCCVYSVVWTVRSVAILGIPLPA